MRYIKRQVEFELYEVNLIDADESELVEINKEMALTLNLDEIKRVKDYFAAKERDPTDIELQAIAQSWSEHCCYKSSKPILDKFIFGIDAPQNILLGEDAGVVEFDDEYAYVVAFESHNHPSAIEPYGGAATGIGGIVRDVLCMGAQPVALIDPLFFGPLDYPYDELPSGVKHPKYIFDGVVAGISDYGNRIGIPTCAGMVYFDDGYVCNCVVNVGCVGIVKGDKIVRSRTHNGDILVLVGGKTGRDGIHGVTFASAVLGENTEELRPAVQLGDPITKEPLIHAILEANENGLISGMKDLGGGGLSCAVGEMCMAGKCGAEIELDRVPLKEREIKPWEIWVSESQERLLLSIHPDNVEEVLYIFKRWDIDATVIGEAIPDEILRIWYKNGKVFEMDTDFIYKPRSIRREYKLREIERRDTIFDEPDDYNAILLRIISSPNVASKEHVIRRYDFEVRASTLVKPLQGEIGKQTHGDAVVIKPLEDSYSGIALSADVNPSYMRVDPYWGAASAIDEACRNLCAVGAYPHSFADCLNFGNPEKASVMGDFHEACRGMHYVTSSLGIPLVSGNVSFYNELRESIPPTPTVLGIGIIPDIRKAITVDAKSPGNHLYIVGETKNEIGGGEYARLMNVSGKVPEVDPIVLKSVMNAILSAMGLVVSCHDISEGGLAISICEMLIGGDVGAEIDLSPLRGRSDYKLFSESNTRWVVEIKKEKSYLFEGMMKDKGIEAYSIGIIGGSDLIVYDGKKELIDLPVEDIRHAWEEFSEYMW